MPHIWLEERNDPLPPLTLMYNSGDICPATSPKDPEKRLLLRMAASRRPASGGIQCTLAVRSPTSTPHRFDTASMSTHVPVHRPGPS